MKIIITNEDLAKLSVSTRKELFGLTEEMKKGLEKDTGFNDEDQDTDSRDKVNLLTIHAAKGLEFDTVFLAGLEEGMMPHARSIEENDGEIEEERRLFYVAITRAQRRLVLSACRSRRRRGQVCEALPSPFLDELPRELLSIQEEEAELAPEDASRYFAEIKRRMGSASG